MTSRTSGTRRLDRAAALRIVFLQDGVKARRPNSGKSAGKVVFNPDSPVISRDLRDLS
jgi:hypothetical protein